LQVATYIGLGVAVFCLITFMVYFGRTPEAILDQESI
jgi:hypothetical protein